MVIEVYYSSVSGNLEVKKHQQRIRDVLSGKKIETEYIDVAASEEAREKMRALIGDPKANPPQIFNGDQYCGNFVAFDNAVEDDELESFLKLK